MAREIELKFIWQIGNMPTPSRTLQMRQGYIAQSDNSVVRVRSSHVNCPVKGGYSEAFITVKSRNAGIARDEFEYEIPVDDAAKMIASTQSVIEKTRHEYNIDGHTFEGDVFTGRHLGLAVIEIEFKDNDESTAEEQAAAFDASQYEFLGSDVSDDNTFSNHYLSTSV